MAGVKGQKSGGFGGRKTLPDEIKRSITISMRVSEEEKILIEKARGKKSLREYVVEKATEDIKK